MISMLIVLYIQILFFNRILLINQKKKKMTFIFIKFVYYEYLLKNFLYHLKYQCQIMRFIDIYDDY